MNLRAWLSGLVDVRPGEARATVQAFVALFFLISAHTILETARDALLLTKLPSSAIGIVYIAVAVCALPAAALASKASVLVGARRALGFGLVLAAAVLTLLFFLHTGRISVVATYVTSGLVGAVLVAQFWGLVGTMFTVGQGRRLLGPIASAGVLGGAVGSGAAAALVPVLRVKALLLVTAGLLVLTAFGVLCAPADERAAVPAPKSPSTLRSTNDLRKEPFLGRIALLAVASTAAAVTLDYFFKWSIARNVSHEQMVPFVARYYAALNAASLLAQIFVGGRLVRRAGVPAAIVFTPFLIVLGGIGTLATGGTLLPVLILKAIDGTLRNSVNRLTTELVYLPVAAVARARAKPFIDGALVRLTQALAGSILLGLGAAGYFAPRLLEIIVVTLTGVWLALAVTTGRPYLDLLRRAITRESLETVRDDDPIDAESADVLVGLLAGEQPRVAMGAMNALARRGRDRLIPALILWHDDSSVVVHALRIFASSRRDDWISRARRLLADPQEAVRMAAAHALAMHGRLGARDIAAGGGPQVRGYAAVHLALEGPETELQNDEHIRGQLDVTGPDAEPTRLGMLGALADAAASARSLPLLQILEASSGPTRAWTLGLATAATAQRAEAMIPQLISRLSLREGREAVNTALVSFGQRGIDEVWRALCDTARERTLRVHLPNTLARFEAKAVAGLLLESIETEKDGLVRYKSIRALGRATASGRPFVNRVRVERLAYSNLIEYFRLLGLRTALAIPPRPDPPTAAVEAPTGRLLVGLLDDKLRQSVERTFRLLKVAFPREDIHRVQIACLSDDKRARANAGEFLDVLLHRRDQSAMRDLLRIVTDDLSDLERVARARPLISAPPPASPKDALDRLVHDADETVAALSSLHAAAMAGLPAKVKIGGGLYDRPLVELSTRHTLPDALLQEEHGLA